MNILSIKVADCQAILVGRVILVKNPQEINLSNNLLKCTFHWIFNKSMFQSPHINYIYMMICVHI